MVLISWSRRTMTLISSPSVWAICPLVLLFSSKSLMLQSWLWMMIHRSSFFHLVLFLLHNQEHNYISENKSIYAQVQSREGKRTEEKGREGREEKRYKKRDTLRNWRWMMTRRSSFFHLCFFFFCFVFPLSFVSNSISFHSFTASWDLRSFLLLFIWFGMFDWNRVWYSLHLITFSFFLVKYEINTNQGDRPHGDKWATRSRLWIESGYVLISLWLCVCMCTASSNHPWICLCVRDVYVDISFFLVTIAIAMNWEWVCFAKAFVWCSCVQSVCLLQEASVIVSHNMSSKECIFASSSSSSSSSVCHECLHSPFAHQRVDLVSLRCDCSDVSEIMCWCIELVTLLFPFSFQFLSLSFCFCSFPLLSDSWSSYSPNVVRRRYRKRDSRNQWCCYWWRPQSKASCQYFAITSIGIISQTLCCHDFILSTIPSCRSAI